MFVATLFGRRKSDRRISLRGQCRERRATRRLRLEALEDRNLMTSYSAVDLGALPGYEWSIANDINDAGQVVGYAVDLETNATRAFLWDGDTGMIDLGTLGGAWSQAIGINDSGQIVGIADTGALSPNGYPISRPFLWHDGVMTELGLSGAPVAINASGQIAANGGVGALVYDIATGTTTNLGILEGYSVSYAADINDAGQVAGTAYYYDESSSFNTGFLWTPATPNGSSGAMVGVWGFWGESTTATALNAAGEVAGYASGVYYPYGGWGPGGGDDAGGGGAWFPDPVYYNYAFLAAPDVEALYVPAESDTFAYDLNDVGQVVGSAVAVGYSNAVVWQDGAISFLGGVPGVWLDYANAINNAGQIVAHGFDEQGQEYAFLLTPEPSLSIGDVYVVEGNSGTANAVFTVTLSPASSETVFVNYATGNGNAAAGSDFLAAAGTLTFSPGDVSKTIVVAVNGDRLGESTESFFVNLSSATNAVIADGQGVGTIVDDEPRISIGDVTTAEGRKNQTMLFTFTVTLSAAYDQPVTMSFRTVNGTATTSNRDYVAKSGTLTFAPGETTKTITIEVKGDNRKEANETFYLDLFDLSTNASFTKDRGIGTILNDD